MGKVLSSTRFHVAKMIQNSSFMFVVNTVSNNVSCSSGGVYKLVALLQRISIINTISYQVFCNGNMICLEGSFA